MLTTQPADRIGIKSLNVPIQQYNMKLAPIPIRFEGEKRIEEDRQLGRYRGGA